MGNASDGIITRNKSIFLVPKFCIYSNSVDLYFFSVTCYFQSQSTHWAQRTIFVDVFIGVNGSERERYGGGLPFILVKAAPTQVHARLPNALRLFPRMFRKSLLLYDRPRTHTHTHTPWPTSKHSDYLRPAVKRSYLNRRFFFFFFFSGGKKNFFFFWASL